MRHEQTAIERVPGSNSFAVSGALSGGATLIADDVHLDLRVPSLIWPSLATNRGTAAELG